ncbi:hypothetical protein, partial [Paractinoplanes rishiriensis]|uniref:hypothetical protein n=1 Tax=Paractinoplanes rishiriensis TaxID=1050105 RepID=UPI0019420E2D
MATTAMSFVPSAGAVRVRRTPGADRIPGRSGRRVAGAAVGGGAASGSASWSAAAARRSGPRRRARLRTGPPGAGAGVAG